VKDARDRIAVLEVPAAHHVHAVVVRGATKASVAAQAAQAVLAALVVEEAERRSTGCAEAAMRGDGVGAPAATARLGGGRTDQRGQRENGKEGKAKA